jgi:branched-chain amino acid transport system permease protein
MKSVRYVAIVAVGGMANFHGTVVMGTLLTFLSLRGYFGSLDDLVFGGILLAMMLFAPEGIVGGDIWRRLRAAFGSKRRGDDGTAA